MHFIAFTSRKRYLIYTKSSTFRINFLEENMKVMFNSFQVSKHLVKMWTKCEKLQNVALSVCDVEQLFHINSKPSKKNTQGRGH